MGQATNPDSLTLDAWALGRLFPFHFVLARDLSIVGVGPALGRCLSLSPQASQPFASLFSVARPEIEALAFEQLAALGEGIVVLRSTQGLHLQGQFERFGHDALLFACSPVVDDLAALQRLQLTVRDFAAHDSAGDYLLLMQSTKTSLADLERVSEDLRQQQAELRATQRRLEVALLESRQATGALRGSEQRYRRVVESTKKIIFETDIRSRWTFLNAQWTETLGYSVAESLGRSALDFIFPEDRDGSVREFALVTERKQDEYRRELRFVSAAGEVRWFEAFARLVFDDDGQALGTAGTLNDITDRHAAMERLEEARQQMGAAKALAESANQAKSDFIASMSHEMRTPLHVLLGMVDLLQETALSADQRELMRVVRTNAGMLRHLVGDLLDLAKIEQGWIQIDSGPLDPRQLVEDACALAVNWANGKAIEIRPHVEPTVPPLLEGDEMRVRQVLVNLVTNAVKFTHQGTVKIGVSFETTGGHDGVLGFNVSDTGVGINAGDQARLFQRFQRADGARNVSGTGLGLFISRSLVELMGGEIAFSSQEGAGSTFRFTVPCRVLARSGEQSPAETTSTVRSAQKRAARILVVEDYESSQQFVRQVLRGEGYEVDIVATGAGALAATARCRYDLVLMDIYLPDLSGLEAARRIRAAEPGRGDERVPMVAMTAHAVHGIHRQCSEAGMEACATKPLSANDLRCLVARWVDARPTVLVADDSLVTQDLVRRHLSALGVRTAGASSGHDVLTQLRRQPVALLVMDLMMPGMDGVATMGAIRSRASFASLPIAILSGAADDERRRQVEDLGCAAFLVKPVARDRLLQVVSGVIGQPPPPAAMAQPPMDEAGDLTDLIPEYLAACRASLAKARASLSAGKLDHVESVGHNLKGTGASYGYEAISQVGRTLELAAGSGDASRASEVLAELELMLSKIPPFVG